MEKLILTRLSFKALLSIQKHYESRIKELYTDDGGLPKNLTAAYDKYMAIVGDIDDAIDMKLNNYQVLED